MLRFEHQPRCTEVKELGAKIKEQENSGMGARAEVNLLSQQHASLDAVIIEESQRPNPDFLKISQLKREKLRLKEQIEMARRH